MIAYRFMERRGCRLVSVRGDLVWPERLGEAVVHEGPLRLCYTGLHASRTPALALCGRQGHVLARVECDDPAPEHDDGLKFCSRRMAILATWGPCHVAALGVASAALVLPVFERVRSGDARPRRALEAAVAALATTTAAACAYAADYGDAAYAAAYDAAYAAACAYAADYGDAAYAAAADASSAARSAAYAAADASSAARSAAYAADASSAARSARSVGAAEAADFAARESEAHERILRLRGPEACEFLRSLL